MIEGISIDEIPDSWRYLPFGSFCDFSGGTQPPKSTFKGTPGKGYVRLLQIRDFENDKHAVYVPVNKRLRTITSEDISIARYGASIGRILTGKDGAINVAIMTTHPDESQVAKPFMGFALLHADFQTYLTGLGGRAAQAGFNRGEVSRFKFPLPPLPEQRKIAGVLGVVQREIEQQERLLQLTAELKKALLHQLFTQGLHGEPQKQTEIGPVPQSWKVVTLGDLVEDAPQVNMRSEGEREIQYIDVSSISREFLRIDSTAGYVLKDAPGRARKKVKTGDVIFATVRPTLLRVARITPEHDEQVCSTAFCVLRDKNKRAIGRFIYYLAQREQFVKQLAAIESGVSYPAVTDRQVKAQLVPVPHEEEQIEIAAILEACDAKIRMHASKKQSLTDLFRTLLHQLMTAQIRVNKLNPDAPQIRSQQGE